MVWMISCQRVAIAAIHPYQALCVWAVPEGDEALEVVPRGISSVGLVLGHHLRGPGFYSW